MARKPRFGASYVVCLRNDGYEASLEVRKHYRTAADDTAEARGLLRVYDESGEAYLYPAKWFAVVDLAPSVRRSLAATA
jgi:hypothetical protein